MTASSDSPADRIAEIRARVEREEQGGTLSYGDDWRWLLDQLVGAIEDAGHWEVAAKLADENYRAAEAEIERLRKGLYELAGAYVEAYRGDGWVENPVYLRAMKLLGN